MSDTSSSTHKTETAVFISLYWPTWQQWCALGELYEEAVNTGQAYANHSEQARGLTRAGGWNLICPTINYPALQARLHKIIGSHL